MTLQEAYDTLLALATENEALNVHDTDGDASYLYGRELQALRVALTLLHDELENASMMDDEGVAR